MKKTIIEAAKEDILTRYFNKSCLVSVGKSDKRYEVLLDADIISTSGKKKYTDITVLVKPIGAMTDEDFIALSKIRNGSEGAKKDHINRGISLINQVFSNKRYFDVLTPLEYQFIINQGYGVPQLVMIKGKPVVYSIAELLTIGVFKYKI